MPTRVVDLDQVVKNWAWSQYDVNTNWKQRRLRAKELKSVGKYIGLHIDWSDVKFRDETRWTRLAEDKFDSGDSNANDSSVQQPAVVHSQRADMGYTHANILFQTKFLNNTASEQEYTMRAEKTTQSTCTTEIETSFTKGVEMSVKLLSPGEILEANAGFKREQTLTNSEGETIEEELSWGAESTIKVKAGHVAEASLVVDEKKYSGHFVIQTQIRGQVYAEFLNKRDNNAFLKGVAHDIDEIVKDYLQEQRNKGEPVDFITISGNIVTIITEGKCKFRYGIKQEVRVDQKALNSGGS